MKELSIEQKAKAYDEAIERAKEMCTTISDRAISKYIFPELKESEDEKTERILHSISSKMSFHLRDIFTEEEFQCFDAWSNAWLEKQNQNLEKLKLEKGKWYFCIEDYHPRADCTDFYQGEKYRCEKDGVMGVWRIKNPEKYFRECKTPTYAGSDSVRIQSIIQVLEYARSLDAYNQYGKADIDKNISWLEKQGKHTNKVEPNFKVGDKIYLKPEYRMPDDDTPIANTVFEIRAIDDKHYKFDGSYIFIEDQDKYELVEQKPAWSEEDVVKINRIAACLENLNVADNDILLKDVDWLKSLKDRVQPQPSNEWGEKDKGMLLEVKCLVDTLRSDGNSDYSVEELQEMWDWLDTIWQKVEYPQSKQEWSEEDEKHLNGIINYIAFSDHPDDFEVWIDWLESLRPQSTWMPSDEQMNALNDVISSRDIKYDVLSELWKDLEKLLKI